MQRPQPTRKGGEENRPKGSTAREPAGETRTIGSASERPMHTSEGYGYKRRPPTEGHGWVCGSVTKQVKRSGALFWSEGAGYKSAR